MDVYSSVHLDRSPGSPHQDSDICGRSQIRCLLGKKNTGNRNLNGPTWKYNQMSVGTYEKVMNFSWQRAKHGNMKLAASLVFPRRNTWEGILHFIESLL